MDPRWPFVLCLLACAFLASAAQLKVDVNVMPRIVFTGDSQTVGCVGALDYAQMMSWEIPLRVFNRSVGGSNTTHLLYEFGGGTVSVKAGERVVHGQDVNWWAGPYIGQKVRIGTQEYTVDAIEPVDYVKRTGNLHLTEPAREDYTGTDYKFEPGWRVRIADVQPQYACFMYTVNDPGHTSEEFKARLAEIVKRCREAGIQPLFLSGVPMMDAVSGGSHPGNVDFCKRRAQDLLEFCQEHRLPYGDVYRTLDRLDAQRTSVWADTIHPTNDGSIIAVHALRYLLKEMGALDNPHYVRGYRAPGAELAHPEDRGLRPITTAQPRRDKHNRLDQAGHNLQAQRIRDEYGLIAAQDGQSLQSTTPLLFQVGVGPQEKLEGFDVDVALGAPGDVHVYNWTKRRWVDLVKGPQVTAEDCVHEGAIWVAVTGEAPAVDYVAVTLQGAVTRWQPPQCDRAILWPPPGQFEWSQEGNLFPNGALTEADGDRPAGWTTRGEGALYLPAGVVAAGTGSFPDPNGDKFKCPGAKFTQTVRPLDMLIIKAEVERGGNFLVEKVVDDETLDLRRSPKTALGDVEFEVTRSSGLRAVPGGCCLETRPGADWQIRVPLHQGEYRLGFFYRAFDPASMSATQRPTVRPVVRVRTGAPHDPASNVGEGLDCAFLWLRSRRDVMLPRDGFLEVSLGAEGEGAMQYTGFSLQRR